MVKLVKNQYFEEFCLLTIILNSLLLILDDVLVTDNYSKKGMELMAEACSIYFCIEISLRVIAMGFIFTTEKVIPNEKGLPRRFM